MASSPASTEILSSQQTESSSSSDSESEIAVSHASHASPPRLRAHPRHIRRRPSSPHPYPLQNRSVRRRLTFSAAPAPASPDFAAPPPPPLVAVPAAPAPAPAAPQEAPELKMVREIVMCPICQDLMAQNRICGNLHTVCITCYDKLLGLKKCPICRHAFLNQSNRLITSLVQTFGPLLRSSSLAVIRALLSFAAAQEFLVTQIDSKARVFYHHPTHGLATLQTFMEFIIMNPQIGTETNLLLEGHLRRSLGFTSWVWIYPATNSLTWLGRVLEHVTRANETLIVFSFAKQIVLVTRE